MIAEDYDRYLLVEQSIENQKSLLSEADSYRLKFNAAARLPDLIEVNLTEINNKPAHEQKLLMDTVMRDKSKNNN